MGSEAAVSIPVSVLRRILVGALVLVVAYALLAFAWSQRDRMGGLFVRGPAAHIDQSTYQAVFLTGGQVYFGKASPSGDEVLLLSDVYYLTGQTQSNPVGQLIKRGSELHAPQEPMIIPSRQVLFIENLRPESEVVKAIARFRAGEVAPPASPEPPVPVTSPSPSPSPTPAPRPSPTR